MFPQISARIGSDGFALTSTRYAILETQKMEKKSCDIGKLGQSGYEILTCDFFFSNSPAARPGDVLLVRPRLLPWLPAPSTSSDLLCDALPSSITDGSVPVVVSPSPSSRYELIARFLSPVPWPRKEQNKLVSLRPLDRKTEKDEKRVMRFFS